MRRVVIHQPDFVPYLGFFHRLVDADVLILLDDVQFQKGGWNHRDRIKTRTGPRWLTLPIDRGPLAREIRDVCLQKGHPDWYANNLNLLVESYQAAPFFESVLAEVQTIYRGDAVRMTELNYALLGYLMRQLDVAPEVVWASELGVGGRGIERLVRLVEHVGGSHYLSGTGALDYLETEPFRRAAIALEIQKFEHPVYDQLHGAFVSGLSSLDALFHCGPRARDLIR